MSIRYFVTRINLIFALIVVSAALSACVGFSSRNFEPNTLEGKNIYKQAKKNVYPKQVRQAPEKYANQTIAWAGIVKDTKPIKSKYGSAILVFVEHHYFDWIEDHGAQPELYFLSPRGEGDFMFFMKAEKQFTKAEVAQRIPKGTMVVAVGQVYVRLAQDKTKPLALLTLYFQFIDPMMYRTDVFDYGRLGEPIRRVPDGAFWKQYGPK